MNTLNDKAIKKLDKEVNEIKSRLLDKTHRKGTNEGEPFVFLGSDLANALTKPFEQLVNFGLLSSEDLNDIVVPIIQEFRDADRIKLGSKVNLYSKAMMEYKYFCEVTLMEALHKGRKNTEGKINVTFSIDAELLSNNNIALCPKSDKIVFLNLDRTDDKGKAKDGDSIQPSINYTNLTSRQANAKLKEVN